MKTLKLASVSNEIAAVMWAAVGKIAGKEGNRDDLAAGSMHALRLELRGDVDGQFFEESISAQLSVGHDQTRASSVNPDPPHLLALVLSKLNPATRDKILRELPEAFAAAGGELPAVDSQLIAAAGQMLERLRAKRPSLVRGAVHCHYQKNETEPEPAATLRLAPALAG